MIKGVASVARQRFFRKVGYEGNKSPRVVAIIDDLERVMAETDSDVGKALSFVLKFGEKVGVHVIFSIDADALSARELSALPVVPVRVVGRVETASKARAAAGIAGTGAERLAGRGEFIAIAEGRMMRFQGAHVSPREITNTVGKIIRNIQDAQGAQSHTVLPRTIQLVTRAFGEGQR